MGVSVLTAAYFSPGSDLEKPYLDTVPKYVDEVIMVYQNDGMPPGLFEETGNIKRIYMKYWGPWNHAYAIHEAMKYATQEYFLICDIDVFFYTNVPGYFLQAMAESNLQMIGTEHYMDVQGYGKFPCIICFMIHRDNLPGPDFLAGKLFGRDHFATTVPDEYMHYGSHDGIYLLPSAIPETRMEYPHPDVFFDTGSNLYYWAKINDFRWASIGTPDGMVYDSSTSYSNCGAHLNPVNLLFHRSMMLPVPKYLEHYERYGPY